MTKLNKDSILFITKELYIGKHDDIVSVVRNVKNKSNKIICKEVLHENKRFIIRDIDVIEAIFDNYILVIITLEQLNIYTEREFLRLTDVYTELTDALYDSRNEVLEKKQMKKHLNPNIDKIHTRLVSCLMNKHEGERLVTLGFGIPNLLKFGNVGYFPEQFILDFGLRGKTASEIQRYFISTGMNFDGDVMIRVYAKIRYFVDLKHNVFIKYDDVNEIM